MVLSLNNPMKVQLGYAVFFCISLCLILTYAYTSWHWNIEVSNESSLDFSEVKGSWFEAQYSPIESSGSHIETLIMFATVDDDEEQYRRDNLRFFLDQGYLNFPEYKFLLIINGCHRLNLSSYTHRYNFYILERKNVCYDAGAWLDGLNHMESLGFSFKQFVFLNSSVRGPFLPGWTTATFDWVREFTAHLSETVKLVGTSINCMILRPSPIGLDQLHLQSMAFATDDIGMDCCIRKVLEFPQCDENWKLDDVVYKRELRYSSSILKANYSIHSNLQAFRDLTISLDNREEVIRRCKAVTRHSITDLYFQNNYGDDISINPLEVMFFKTSRNVEPQVLKSYTLWADPDFENEEKKSNFLHLKSSCAGAN